MKRISWSLSLMLLVVSLSMSSCFVNRLTVGDGPVGRDRADKAKYSKAKQVYLLWGLIAIGQAQPAIPPNMGYQYKTSYNFWDALVSALTAGIVSLRTEKIYVFKDAMKEVKMERKMGHQGHSEQPEPKK